jgi:hypothetical protein
LLALASLMVLHCATGSTDVDFDDDDDDDDGTTVTGTTTGAGGAMPCAPPNTTCGTECVDLATHPGHCGECFNACGLGEVCAQATCGGTGTGTGTGTGAGTGTGTGTGTGSGTGVGTGTGTGAGTGTGTGGGTCDPLNPLSVCGANQHCIPAPCPSTSPTCLGPTGSSTQDALCFDRSECGDIFECVDDGYATWCLQWCRIGYNDCAAYYGYSCVELADPGVCIGSQEWGVCY